MSDSNIKVNGACDATVLTCRSGAAAVEFALLLPLLLVLMFGTFQTGLLMYSYNVMASTARDTARSMAVCTVTDPVVAANDALLSLPKWVPQSGWAITPVTDNGNGDVSMTISVDPAKAAIIPYVPFGFSTLTAYVEMKKEPLASGGGHCP